MRSIAVVDALAELPLYYIISVDCEARRKASKMPRAECKALLIGALRHPWRALKLRCTL